jgi:RNA polymerase sigma-70 factor (ECF subfamily)
LSEDIFQDTFIKAVTTIQQGRYVDTGKFLGWINRIAHNLIIDYFRKLRNENTFSADGIDFDILHSSAKLTELSIEDVISNEQVLLDTVSLMDFLPENQKEVIRMRFFEDLSFKEIADKTNVSINTALGRMRYALINMRKIASDKGISLEIK